MHHNQIKRFQHNQEIIKMSFNGPMMFSGMKKCEVLEHLVFTVQNSCHHILYTKFLVLYKPVVPQVTLFICTVSQIFQIRDFDPVISQKTLDRRFSSSEMK